MPKQSRKKSSVKKKLPATSLRKRAAIKKPAVKKHKTSNTAKQSPAANTQEHLHYHKDGSLWARGEKLAGELHGYWEWYRKDGTRMRSGHFEHGVQCGEWITYDKGGKIYKVTQMKPKAT